VPVAPASIQLTTTVLEKGEARNMVALARRLDARTLVVETRGVRRMSTDDGATWSDSRGLPLQREQSSAVFAGSVHLLRLPRQPPGPVRSSLLHRTLDSDTEHVAFQLEPPQRGFIDHPALVSLPDGLLATFTLERSDKDSRLHALRWTQESGWVQLGVIPGAALHLIHPASLVSDARGNAYVAFVHDPGFDPDSTARLAGDRPFSLVIMRSRDAGASWQVVARDLSARACPPGMDVSWLEDVRLVVSAEGELTVYWKQRNRDLSLLKMRDVTQTQLMVSRSADGEHWSSPQRLEDADLKTTRGLFDTSSLDNLEEVSRQSATAPVFGASPNGRSQVVFWRDARQGAARLFLRVSQDGGKSWTPVTPVEPERSALAWPEEALPTDAGPIHLFWVGDDGTANHTVARVTP
jgi:hypothetical protein